MLYPQGVTWWCFVKLKLRKGLVMGWLDIVTMVWLVIVTTVRLVIVTMVTMASHSYHGMASHSYYCMASYYGCKAEGILSL